MKANKLLLCVMLLLTIASISVFADARIDEATASPAVISFTDRNPVQVTVIVKVRNPNDVAVQNVELKGTVTGPSTISDTPTLNFALTQLQTVTRTLVFNFPRNAKPDTYTFSIKATDTTASTSHTVTRQLTVNSAPLIDLLKDGNTVSEINVKGEPGDENIELAFTLQNIGNIDLTNVRLNTAFTSLKDEDDDLVLLSLTTTSVPSLPIDGTATFKVRTTIQSGFDAETLSGSLEVSSDQLTTKQTFPMKIDVRPLSCKASASSGGLKVDIVEPDENDEFEPGDIIKARIDVTNNGNDNKRVRVEATLFNLDENRVIESDTEEQRVNDGDEEHVFFTFDLSEDDEDLDEDADLRFYIKAFERGNEDNICVEDDIDVDFKLPDHKVIFDSLSINPLTVNCGSQAVLSAIVRNVGSNDERVTLKAENTALGISESLPQVEVPEDRDENTYSASLRLNVPRDIENGAYPLDVSARYGSRTETQQVTLTAINCVKPSPADTGSQNNGASGGTAAGSVSVGAGDQSASYTGAVTADKGFWEDFSTGSFKVPTYVWVLVDIVLVLAVISLLVFLFRRHS